VTEVTGPKTRRRVCFSKRRKSVSGDRRSITGPVQPTPREEKTRDCKLVVATLGDHPAVVARRHTDMLPEAARAATLICSRTKPPDCVR
jgi:hypothetical protein